MDSNRFTRRRTRNLAAAFVVAVLVVWLLDVYDLRLGRRSYVSGYFMFGVVLFLAAFNLRKKLPMLPLGSASTWLQLHLYVGLVSGILFGVHVGWRLPNGMFETALFVTFMMTFMSGVSGIYISRSVPKLLMRAGHEVVYERIPQVRHLLARRSQETVLNAVSASGSTTLAEFYVARLYDFFTSPVEFGYLLRPTSRRRRRLMHEMSDLDRYLSADERKGCEELFNMLRKKDDLDFHEARQRMLKVWLFVHIALTCLLITLGTVHGMLALAFRGDAL